MWQDPSIQLARNAVVCAQAKAGAAQVQALKQHRMRMAAEAATPHAPADDGDNVLIHWVRSASDMRLKVGSIAPCRRYTREVPSLDGVTNVGYIYHICVYELED